MQFLFYIDGQLTDAPDNEQELATTIKRDRQFGAQLITQDIELQYNGNNSLPSGRISGYSLIKSLFDSGVCQQAPIEIYAQISNTSTQLVHKGIIKIPQVSIDEQQVIAKFALQDNSFYSLVAINRDLKVDLRTTKSKNKVPITPLDIWEIDMFNSATGVYGSTIGAMYEMYRISELFEFIIQVISDGEVGFRSDYLDNMDPEPFLIKGQGILNPPSLFPLALDPIGEISFSELFDEINKCKNISFYIDQSDPNNPILRLENTELTYSSTIIHHFSDIKDIITSVNTNNLYGSVRVGTAITTDGQDDANLYPWNEARSYYGWKIENFFPLGQCNTNTELNLVNQWVLSNNVIQEIIYGQSTNYNDNYFLIECESVDPITRTAYAKRYSFFGQPAPPYFYNIGLNNFNKLKRHSEKFEQEFGTFFGTGGGTFKALHGDGPAQDTTYVTAPASNPNFIPIGGGTWQGDYPNETTLDGFDDGNNWDNISNIYVVPSSGDYSFHQHLNFEIAGIISTAYFQVISHITLLDAGINVKDSDSQGVLYGGGWGQPGNGLHLQDHTWVCNAEIGDIVRASYTIEFVPNQDGNLQNPRTLTITYESYFECNGAPDAGISITSGNLQIKKYLHEFTDTIGAADWQTIKSNPTSMVTFEKDGLVRQGWMYDVKRNDFTGQTQIKIITSSTEGQNE